MSMTIFPRRLIWLTLVFTALIFGSPWAATAQGCIDGNCQTLDSRVVTSTGILPFQGSVFDAVTGEIVDIAGAVHVMTQVGHPTDPTAPPVLRRALLNLPADVQAVGRGSGASYIAFGAVLQPVDPQQPIPIVDGVVSLVAHFQLVGKPIDPQRGGPGQAPLSVAVNLDFSDGGALLASSDAVLADQGPERGSPAAAQAVQRRMWFLGSRMHPSWVTIDGIVKARS
jgi:hypothetical protein